MTIAATDELISVYIPEITESTRAARVGERLAELMESRDGNAGTDRDAARRGLAPAFREKRLDIVADERDLYFSTFIEAVVDVWAPNGGIPVLPESVRSELVARQRSLAFSALLRSLLDELHHRRDAGFLSAATSEARFDEFSAWITSEAGVTVFANRHDGALAAAHRAVTSAGRVAEEAFRRIEADRGALAREFPGLDPESPVRLLGIGGGDTHRGGRSVGVVEFVDGQRVVYKPRSVGTDTAWNGLLGDLRNLGVADLRPLRCLDRGRYGYTEFVQADPPGAPDVAYLDDIGTLTAVLHLANGSDMHHENVITSGGRAVVVDTETVLTPRPVVAESYDDGAASKVAKTRITDSVLGIGILPNLVKVPGREQALDIGAVGYAPGQTGPYRSLLLVDAGRDDMRTTLAHASTTVASANPVLDRDGDVRAVREPIRDAFRRTLERAAARRADVQRAFVERFEGTEVRYVHAPTMFYAQLLRMATHPDLLEDERARAAVMYRVALREGAAATSLADLEFAELLNGDVPYFWCDADGRDLHNAKGAPVPSFFVESPLERVRQRIAGLELDAIEEQSTLLDLAFVNRLPREAERTVLATGTRHDAARPNRRRGREASARAHRAASRIADSVVSSPDPAHPATWIGPQVTTSDQAQWLPGTLGYDLYGGSTGVALFLAASAAVNGDERVAAVAERVFAPIERQLVDRQVDPTAVSGGGMTGMGGTVWALSRSRRLLAGTGLRPERQDPGADGVLLQRLAESVQTDTSADFTSGLAGTLAAALDIEGGSQSPSTDVIAERLCSVLRIPADGRPRYTGYAHGTAGILRPLLAWADSRDDERARDLGGRLLAELVSARHDDGEYPRQFDGDPAERSWAWCHGAPGILLGLLGARESLPEHVPDSLLRPLVTSSVERALGNNPTLCHGDAGTLDILAEAAEVLGDDVLASTVDDAFATLLDDGLLVGRRRDSKYDHTDSLMVGTAGIGWTLLRHAADRHLPSVLSLS